MQKDVIAAGVIVTAALVAATVLLIRDNTPRIVVERVAEVSPPPTPFAPAPKAAKPAPPTQPTVAPVVIAPKQPPTPAPARRNRVAAAPAPTRADEPAARNALALVGTDAQAEEVWYSAINDPNLTPDERKNLIEDLNETGFADPRNLTANDLPVIEYRIQLIEAVGNDAMDEVNFAAFQEAYKDLLNMRQRVAGG